MTKAKRGRYTLEFKQEAVGLWSRARRWLQQHAALECRADLGQLDQVASNWNAEGCQRQASGGAPSRWRSAACGPSWARVTMERDILGKATAFFAKGQK